MRLFTVASCRLWLMFSPGRDMKPFDHTDAARPLYNNREPSRWYGP
jgi:hypothetical protein